MRPTRDIANSITAHFRCKERSTYEVVEEIKKALISIIDGLDKPTYLPGRRGQDGTPGSIGAGGATFTHFLDDHWAYWAPLPDPQDTDEATRSAGIRWRTRGSDPNRFEIQVGNGNDRAYLRRFASTDLDLNPTEIRLDDEVSFDSNPAPSVYRGLSIAGTTRVTAIAATPTPGPELIENGTFEGGTYASRSATHPDQWVMADDGSMTISPNGFGGGNCIRIDVTSGKQLKTRAQQTNFTVPGTSPSGGTDTCIGDAGGPGITNGTLANFQLAKNTIYQLTFRARLNGGSSSTRHLSFGLYAHGSDTEFGTCSGGVGYSLGGDSAGGAVTGTFSTWNSSLLTSARFLDVPFDSTYRLYTATIDTTGVGGLVTDPFFANFYVATGLTGTGSFDIDNISLRIPAAAPIADITADLTIRGLSEDQWRIELSAADENDQLTISGLDGLVIPPTLVPITAATASITVPSAKGARFGFHLDDTDHLGTLNAPDVVSAYFEEPEFGSDPFAAEFDGTVGILRGQVLRFYRTSNAFYTSFRAGAQAANIDYVLPLVQGNASDVLTNDGAGALSWAPGGSSGSGGFPEQLGYISF